MFLFARDHVSPGSFNSIGILSTNRQLYYEASAVLYGTNVFRFSRVWLSFRLLWEIGSFNLSLIRKLELSWNMVDDGVMRVQHRIQHGQELGEKERQVIREWLDRTVGQICETLKLLAAHCYCLNSLKIRFPYLIIKRATIQGEFFRMELFTSSPAIRAEMEKIRGVVYDLMITTPDYDEAERVARIMRVKHITVDWGFSHPAFDEPNYTEWLREMEGKGWLVGNQSHHLCGSKTLRYGDELDATLTVRASPSTGVNLKSPLSPIRRLSHHRRESRRPGPMMAERLEGNPGKNVLGSLIP
jgi:hypothetical protein